MLALGIGVLTMVGLQAVSGSIHSAVAAGWSGLAADTYQVLALGGFVDAVAYWLAAVTSAVAWLALSRLAPLPGAL
jgi:hypothetical protein